MMKMRTWHLLFLLFLSARGQNPGAYTVRDLIVEDEKPYPLMHRAGTLERIFAQTGRAGEFYTTIKKGQRSVVYKESATASPVTFHEGKRLGRGTFGTVDEMLSDDGKSLAMKEIRLDPESIESETTVLNKPGLQDLYATHPDLLRAREALERDAPDAAPKLSPAPHFNPMASSSSKAWERKTKEKEFIATELMQFGDLEKVWKSQMDAYVRMYLVGRDLTGKKENIFTQAGRTLLVALSTAEDIRKQVDAYYQFDHDLVYTDMKLANVMVTDPKDRRRRATIALGDLGSMVAEEVAAEDAKHKIAVMSYPCPEFGTDGLLRDIDKKTDMAKKRCMSYQIGILIAEMLFNVPVQSRVFSVTEIEYQTFRRLYHKHNNRVPTATARIVKDIIGRMFRLGISENVDTTKLQNLLSVHPEERPVIVGNEDGLNLFDLVTLPDAIIDRARGLDSPIGAEGGPGTVSPVQLQDLPTPPVGALAPTRPPFPASDVSSLYPSVLSPTRPSSPKAESKVEEKSGSRPSIFSPTNPDSKAKQEPRSRMRPFIKFLRRNNPLRPRNNK